MTEVDNEEEFQELEKSIKQVVDDENIPEFDVVDDE